MYNSNKDECQYKYNKTKPQGDKTMKKVQTIEIFVGKTYKNFKGHWRKVLAIMEEAKGVNVTYDDGTGAPRTCKIGSFRQWIKKNYY